MKNRFASKSKAAKSATTRSSVLKTDDRKKLATKRKKRLASDQKATASKRQCFEAEGGTLVRVPKEVVHSNLSAEVVEHIESLMNTALLSVLSKKRAKDFDLLQAELTPLENRLMKQCKKNMFPRTKLENLKNLSRDVAEERRKLEANEEILESLNSETEKAVQAAEDIEDSISILEEKLKTLRSQKARTAVAQCETEQAENTEDSLQGIPKTVLLQSAKTAEAEVANTDPLQLPKATFEATPYYEKVKKLKNPEKVLKELSRIESNPAYKGMSSLIEKVYAEVCDSAP
ncbi:centromere protein Q [Hyperolius riggenbachi]|uniref:centromere protein Q n=1 Tax=Hyperolius riggenbachi TaxID=752182 RepID=UPI0035A2D084